MLSRHPLGRGGLLSNVVEVSAQQLSSLDIVPPIQLLVDGVSGIGRAAHRKQQDVLAGGLLESQCNRNAVELVSFQIPQRREYRHSWDSEWHNTYLPPSRVISGSTPKTCCTALPAAVKFQCLGLATHHLPSC